MQVKNILQPGEIYGKYTVLGRNENGKYDIQCLGCNCVKSFYAGKFINNVYGCAQCSSKKYVNARIKPEKIYGGLQSIKKVEPTEKHRETWLVECLGCKSRFNLVDYSIKRNKVGCKECGLAYGNALGNGIVTGRMYGRFKYGASRRNIDFNLSIEDMIDQFDKQEGRCFYSGRVLDKNNISMDRTDSSIGYVVGNITLVCKSVNFMKYNLPEDEFLALIYDINDWSRR